MNRIVLLKPLFCSTRPQTQRYEINVMRIQRFVLLFPFWIVILKRDAVYNALNIQFLLFSFRAVLCHRPCQYSLHFILLSVGSCCLSLEAFRHRATGSRSMNTIPNQWLQRHSFHYQRDLASIRLLKRASQWHRKNPTKKPPRGQH